MAYFRIGLVLVFASAFFFQTIKAQSLTQTVKGVVVDADAESPLIGATVMVVSSEPLIATTTDIDGQFKLENVPIGRQTLEIRYLGFETGLLPNLVVTSGKELVVKVGLTETTETLEEVVVKASDNKQEPTNEMASVSARSFSVEETQRYAASLLDPARMAQNYAGVSSAGDDLSNEIVIRGNSPAYVQWRLEGLQIPGPNHFSTKGSSGGGISMLSSSMLTNSDFYTGAFPAEIGNALAGAFDLKFRNGNSDKREHSFMFGLIGTEISTEGPFSKNSRASYLINYRYSTLKVLDQIGLSPVDVGDTDLDFQDLSFKINVPTKKAGVFSLFGLGGLTRAGSVAVADVNQWNDLDDIFTFSEKGNFGTVGLTHRYLLSNRTYIKTAIGATYDQYRFDESFFDLSKDYQSVVDELENLVDKQLRATVTFNHKFNANHTIRIGGVLNNLGYEFNYDDRDLDYQGDYVFDYSDPITLIASNGNTNLWQGFAQWKYRINPKWTLNTGLHYMYLSLNGQSSIEPRGSIKYQFSPKQSITFAAGLHSQMEHLINYLLIRERQDGTTFQPNRDLPLTKAAHFIIGYDHNFSSDFRLKVETYYQRLFDVPIDSSFRRGSIINAESVYDVLFDSRSFQGNGLATNYGIDLTLEKFYSKGYYALLTGSLFDSKFENAQGETFSTRYNARFNLTALAGKEYQVGKGLKNTFAMNGKIIYTGGNRYDEIDWDRSIEEGFVVTTDDGIYKEQVKPYFRIDASAKYSINRPKATHSIMLEIQNVLNRENVFGVNYDFNNRRLRETFQSGLIPNLNYRIEF